jgi:hypothetical protein
MSRTHYDSFLVTQANEKDIQGIRFSEISAAWQGCLA